MTEQEWLTCTKPEKMLEFLRGNASERKLRLFACACARQLWQLLAQDVWRAPIDARSRGAVELAEAYVEGGASENDLRAAATAAQAATGEVPVPYPACGEAFPVMVGAFYAEAAVAEAAAEAVLDAAVEDYILLKGDGPLMSALRCIFNPFRPGPLDPTWRTPTVVALAHTIYEGKTWDRLPALGDALEGAGCIDPEILGHCRGPGPHVRGCWALDLVVGKE
jgi:hypothetical protein